MKASWSSPTWSSHLVSAPGLLMRALVASLFANSTSRETTLRVIQSRSYLMNYASTLSLQTFSKMLPIMMHFTAWKTIAATKWEETRLMPLCTLYRYPLKCATPRSHAKPLPSATLSATHSGFRTRMRSSIRQLTKNMMVSTKSST